MGYLRALSPYSFAFDLLNLWEETLPKIARSRDWLAFWKDFLVGWPCRMEIDVNMCHVRHDCSRFNFQIIILKLMSLQYRVHVIIRELIKTCRFS